MAPGFEHRFLIEAKVALDLVLQIKVVDDAGNALPSGQRGELLVRGTSMFAGYWKRPEANAAAFVDGDWFRTGDVATIDDEGYLFIVDRIKDLIIRGGENIGCGHVEAALLMHPLVQEAAVYAVPDERLGEEVGATLYASEALDLDELREFLATAPGALRASTACGANEAAAAANALGQDLQATDSRSGAGRDRAGRCVVRASAAAGQSAVPAPGRPRHRLPAQRRRPGQQHDRQQVLHQQDGPSASRCAWCRASTTTPA